MHELFRFRPSLKEVLAEPTQKMPSRNLVVELPITWREGRGTEH